MKRFVLSILCLCCVIGLISCDGEHVHQWKDEWSYNMESDPIHHWHVCEDAACVEISEKEAHQWQAVEDDSDVNTQKKRCAVCGAEKTEAIPSPYQVTREQWQKALSLETYPTVITQHVYYPATPQSREGFIYLSTVEIDGDKIYMYELDKLLTTKSHEFYYEKVGESYFRYSFNNQTNEWVSREISESAYQEPKIQYVTIGGNNMANYFAYEDITFDAESNTYKCEALEVDFEGEIMNLFHVSFRFENGKMMSYYFEAEIDGYNAIQTTMDYNPVSIAFPWQEN